MKIARENVRKKGKALPGKFSSSYPLLVKEAKRWGFEIPTFQPMENNVVVWRLPPITETPSGLFIPDEHQSPHVKGILIAAGAKAMDSFESNGITLGHTVIFKRFAGWETNDQTPEALRGCRILMIAASDVIGSDNLREDLESGRAKFIKDENGRHNLSVRQISAKKEKVLALAADPSATPAERATAHKLAASLA